MFGELNNGRLLQMCDLGRFDHGARSRALSAILKNGRLMANGRCSVQYRRRLRPFQRYTVKTEIIGRDEKWFYYVRTTIRKGVQCS